MASSLKTEISTPFTGAKSVIGGGFWNNNDVNLRKELKIKKAIEKLLYFQW